MSYTTCKTHQWDGHRCAVSTGLSIDGEHLSLVVVDDAATWPELIAAAGRALQSAPRRCGYDGPERRARRGRHSTPNT